MSLTAHMGMFQLRPRAGWLQVAEYVSSSMLPDLVVLINIRVGQCPSSRSSDIGTPVNGCIGVPGRWDGLILALPCCI